MFYLLIPIGLILFLGWAIIAKKKTMLIIVSVIILVISYFIYDAFYPNEKFYIEEWKNNTQLPFPESAEFIWKDATYPDQHNDYTSTAIINVNNEDYNRLYQLSIDRKLVKFDSGFMGYKGILTQYLPSDYTLECKVYFVTKSSFKIGFGNDGTTIVFQRHSS